jgi:hypothetical protein
VHQDQTARPGEAQELVEERPRLWPQPKSRICRPPCPPASRSNLGRALVRTVVPGLVGSGRGLLAIAGAKVKRQAARSTKEKPPTTPSDRQAPWHIWQRVPVPRDRGGSPRENGASRSPISRPLHTATTTALLPAGAVASGARDRRFPLTAKLVARQLGSVSSSGERPGKHCWRFSQQLEAEVLFNRHLVVFCSAASSWNRNRKAPLADAEAETLDAASQHNGDGRNGRTERRAQPALRGAEPQGA